MSREDQPVLIQGLVFECRSSGWDLPKQGAFALISSWQQLPDPSCELLFFLAAPLCVS